MPTEKYLLAIYRYGTPFPEGAVSLALEVIARHMPDFFPAFMLTGPQSRVIIPDPAAFDPSTIPAEYWIRPGVAVSVPIESNQGTELVVTDYRVAGNIPSSVLISLNKAQALPRNNILTALLIDLSQTLGATWGMVTDTTTMQRDDVYDRFFEIDPASVPSALYWLTWFGPDQVATIGEAAFAALGTKFPVSVIDGGRLLRLQDEPFQEDNPADARRRVEAEEAFGLQELHRRFRRV